MRYGLFAIRSLLIGSCLSVLTLSGLAVPTRAGDILERLKQLSVESACFDFPSVLYFDLSFIEDSTRENTLEVDRYVGRFVKGEKLAYRSDALHVGDPDSGRESVMQHLLCLPNGDRWYAREAVSSGFDKIKINPTHPSTVFVCRCNPFRCAVRGGAEFDAGQQYDLFEKILSNYEEFEGHPNYLRGKTGPIVKKLEFDREVEWKLNRSWDYVPKNRKEFFQKLKEKTKIQSMSEIKDGVCLKEIESFWMPVAEIGPIPCWILDKEEGVRMNDASLSTEMEAFFFGFQFKNIPLETLFDEKRFTEQGIKQDFKIDDVKKMAEKAKIEIQEARKKAKKN